MISQNVAKGFVITSADGQPLEIPPREFYFNTKARCRRMMANDLSSDARRVYACLELATMGFQQEEAVMMDRGKIRGLRPADVVEQTGISKQNVRRAFEELENEGLAKREPIVGKSLTNGNIKIYSWSEPHPTAERLKGSHARLPFPDWFPESWAPLKSLITRLRLEFTANEVVTRDYLSEGEVVARAYQDGLEVATRFLERVCAPPSIYKEERTERTEDLSSSSSFVDQESAAAEEKETTTTTNGFAGAQEETPETQNLPVDGPESAANPQGEVRVLAAELGSDLEAASQLIRNVRKHRPEASEPEIFRACARKVGQLKNRVRDGSIGNMMGFLLVAVPRMAAGPEWLEIRAEIERERIRGQT